MWVENLHKMWMEIEEKRAFACSLNCCMAIFLNFPFPSCCELSLLSLIIYFSLHNFHSAPSHYKKKSFHINLVLSQLDQVIGRVNFIVKFIYKQLRSSQWERSIPSEYYNVLYEHPLLHIALKFVMLFPLRSSPCFGG